MNPGIYPDMTEAIYHGDPCPVPSLSASLCRTIWKESCLHAWTKHPRLNPDYVQTNKKTFDFGSAAHAVLLKGAESKLCVIDADDYRKKDTQEKRDAAYADGKIPILETEYGNIANMVKSAKDFIAKTELAGIFNDGKPEVSLIAEYEGAWLRSRLDWLINDRTFILDYKSTAGSPRPETWIRSHLFKDDLDIQAYLYQLVNGLTGGDSQANFVFFVQENKPPFACSLIGASPAVMESGRRKFGTCLHKWKWCMEKNKKWPTYDTRIHWADVPAWQLAELEVTDYD